MNIKQGYIYLVKYNPSQNGIKKIRPSLIIQNNYLNEVLDTIITIPLSSLKKKRPDYQIKIQAPFLKKESYILTELITSITKNRIKKELGKIPQSDFEKVIQTLEYIVQKT
ncbi:hypothetical protein COV24_03315 [candidate division WWE3 bacterium CG10_big_fil_rev_8_21_14_0_10_32_10]|uniref:mRNA interferase n=1 Tax=candidate division WWE3 bacterium CG10_big_fil_rev_8_21_14_0_10_32_10 TaxID=1975090 RepID=A0A2H0RA28_UNCKA|nr:MAG: hypothetical protein COV24_03315 [candidate division WWE3 bacterium CG10_big_fil_rev_8_21_14_0_10_32_10]